MTAQSITINEVERASFRLRQKILEMEMVKLRIDEAYKKKYLIPRVRAIDYWLGTKYLHHIKWAASLEPSKNLSLKEMTLIDHGGGTGWIGLLAKEAGIGTVIYNELDPKMLDIAREVGKAIGVMPDVFVLGDFDELTGSLKESHSKCTLLVSADCIEHIYDIDDFIHKLPSLSEGPVGLVMSSGANFLSPQYVFPTVRSQRRGERKYRPIREDIIRAAVPGILDNDLRVIANKTRGLIKDEITALAKHYSKTGSLKKTARPVGDFDPYASNLCDPLSGQWEEHFLNPFAFARVLRDVGFDSKVSFGIHNIGQSNPLKRLTAQTLNACVRMLGKAAMPIAPYYVVIGSRMQPKER
jgi:2-polyprenyl-3-methyl-5-hydroxy-6-metoxy-1,4-benzoquinol methylase